MVFSYVEEVTKAANRNLLPLTRRQLAIDGTMHYTWNRTKGELSHGKTLLFFAISGSGCKGDTRAPLQHPYRENLYRLDQAFYPFSS